MFENPLTRKIGEFLTRIGLEVRPRETPETSFLTGIYIENGKLFVEEAVLSFPGDLLHEAGHLAVAPGSLRGLLSDEVELPGFDMDAVESGAIAWSYAAALYLGLDPAVVFHSGGYKGNAEGLLMNFSLGVYLGVNILEDADMTLTGENARVRGVDPYPHMLKWLRD